MNAGYPLPSWVQAGARFNDTTSPRKAVLWHVRAVVDGYAVCCRWDASKQRWHYAILEPEFFEVREANLKPRRAPYLPTLLDDLENQIVGIPKTAS